MTTDVINAIIDNNVQEPLHVVRVVSFGAGQVGESGVLAPLQVCRCI